VQGLNFESIKIRPNISNPNIGKPFHDVKKKKGGKGAKKRNSILLHVIDFPLKSCTLGENAKNNSSAPTSPHAM
jgi:hypothetical protein